MNKKSRLRGAALQFAVVALLMLTGQLAFADDPPTQVDCGSDCDATDPIDVNIYVTTTVNQDVDQWQSGDTIVVTDSNGNTGVYVYHALTGRFVGTGGGGGGGGGGDTGSGGDGSGNDPGGTGGEDPSNSDPTCLDFYGCQGGSTGTF